MNRTPSVCIITPTKNRLNLLCEAIESVQQQSVDAWEHVIVDDGSDDGTTEEVVRRAATDPRIRYIRRTGDRSGANVCRNLGVNATSSEFVIFLDSDDLLSSHCLRQRIDVMERNRDLAFAVFPGKVFTETAGERGRLFSPVTLGSDLDRFLYLDFPWQTTGPIWRRSALNELGLFAEQLPSWQDLELHIRALIAGMKYLKFDTPDHHIRWQYEPTKTSILQFQSPDHLHSGLSIVRGLQTRLSNAGLITWYRRRALAGLIFLLAERWTWNANLSEALRTWIHAHRAGLTPVFLHCIGIVVLLVFRLRLLGPSYNERFIEKFKRAAGLRI